MSKTKQKKSLGNVLADNASAATGTETARKAAIAEIGARMKRLDTSDANATAAAALPALSDAAPVPAAPEVPATGQRRGTGGKPGGNAKPATKEPKPAKAAKPKKASALDAAAMVIAKSDSPMTAAALIETMLTEKLWKSPGGKTPEATLYAAIIREIAAKGTDARFRKVERGLFTAGSGIQA